ncbi:glycosyltransferase [Bacillus licheniformis]|nr:glycosyltransferase [Bacillus licheniformis]
MEIQQLVYWSLFIIQKLFAELFAVADQPDLENIEIIIVNDGSTDGSQKIIDHYARKDGRIKTIQQDNQGLGAVRNKGIEAASGEYLAFIDSDDWIEPDYCQSMYEKRRMRMPILSSVIMPLKFRIPKNGLPGHREEL